MSLIEQLDNKKPYKVLTEDSLKEIIEELIFRDVKRPLKFLRGCAEKGWVLEDSESTEVTLCNNPKCGSCREIEKLLKE